MLFVILHAMHGFIELRNLMAPIKSDIYFVACVTLDIKEFLALSTSSVCSGIRSRCGWWRVLIKERKKWKERRDSPPKIPE